jgi:hypothetical protein
MAEQVTLPNGDYLQVFDLLNDTWDMYQIALSRNKRFAATRRMWLNIDMLEKECIKCALLRDPEEGLSPREDSPPRRLTP